MILFSIKTRYSYIEVTFNFTYFSRKKYQIALKIFIHTQKSIENIKNNTFGKCQKIPKYTN